MLAKILRNPLITAFSFSLITMGCKQETLPKPQAYLALEYPQAFYDTYTNENFGFSFENNGFAKVLQVKKNAIELHYPQMSATVFLTYKPVENNIDLLLKDAQKLTYEHFIKADQIIEQPFENDQRQVYGMVYSVEGNAATSVQFYATDSVKNFLVASLYFYAKPNYDSILPASEYIKKDMKHIMETLQWR